MLRRIFLYGITFSCLLLTGCDDNEDGTVTFLTSYDAAYMLYPDDVLPAADGNIVVLERDNAGIVQKRSGGLIDIPVATGYSYQFVTEVFDVLNYALPQITITQNDALDELDVYPTQRRVVLDASDRIINVIRKTVGDRYDTLDFNYDGDVLREIVVKSRNRIETRRFYYDNSNLIKIESIETNRFLEIRTITLEEFGGYDTAPNPTKDLGIFDEILYRSISKNNFTHYTLEKRDQGGHLLASRDMSWNFQYSNGVPTFR